MTLTPDELEKKTEELTIQALVERIAMLEYGNAQLKAQLTILSQRLQETANALQEYQNSKDSE